MVRRFLYSLLLFHIYICIPQPTFAQQKETKSETKAQKVYHINNVVVHGIKTVKEVTPVQVLSGNELKKLSVHSVADAMRYFSGVQLKDFGGVGGLKTINVRSMGSHHVGVFYDGIQLGNAQNGIVDLGRFSLDNMEAVSMYNGQKSAIFQPAKDFASASAIYMVTRKPILDEDKDYNVNMSLKGGSFKTINPSILWEQRINENVSSSISAEYMYTSGEYKFKYAKINGYDTTQMRENGDVRSLRVEAALFGTINDGEWKAKAYYYDSERGYPGAVVREEPGKFKNQDRQWDKNFFAQGSFRKTISPAYRLLINGKYAYDYLHYLSDPRLDASTMYVNNKYQQQEGYVSAANLFTIFDWWSASLSTDFQLNTLDADLVNFVHPKRSTLLNAVATSIRFDKFKLQMSLLHTFVHDKIDNTLDNTTNRDEFTPTAVASYKPFDLVDLNFRAFYKRVFRMPTLNDLYYTFIGNKNLDPEYTNQYNIGLTYNKNFGNRWIENMEFQIDGYLNQVENKIIAMPTSNQFRWTMINLGYVEIHGVDVALRGNFRIREVGLNARISYTYQDAKDLTDPTSDYYGGQVPYIPWHSGSAILGFDYNNWSLNYSFIYTGERYETVANIKENYVQPWYTHDIALTKEVDFEKVSLRFTAEVNNILNQQYEVVQSYPMPGTNFKLKINILL